MTEFPGNSFETALLRAVWKVRGRRGWWLLEVPVGRNPGSRARRIDALVVHDALPRVSAQGQDLDEFEQAMAAGCAIEVIEAKSHLNLWVVGQLLAGTAMLSERCTGHGPLEATAVVQTANDAALRWFCYRERIRLAEANPDWG